MGYIQALEACNGCLLVTKELSAAKESTSKHFRRYVTVTVLSTVRSTQRTFQAETIEWLLVLNITHHKTAAAADLSKTSA